jgi:hypothetical protein
MRQVTGTKPLQVQTDHPLIANALHFLKMTILSTGKHWLPTLSGISSRSTCRNASLHSRTTMAAKSWNALN